MTSELTTIFYLPPGQIRTWETAILPSSKRFEIIAYHSTPHATQGLSENHGYSLIS